jgi:hypothetical protein
LTAASDFLERQRKAGEAIVSRLTFRPDIPNSLSEGYIKQLQPFHYLAGPREGWDYFRGRWSGAYEGIRTVDRQRGPFALWKGRSFENGLVEARLVLQPSLESASVLLRASAEHDEPRGYEVLFDPRQQRVIIQRHGTNIVRLAEERATLPIGQPIWIAVELAGPRIRVWNKPFVNCSASGSADDTPRVHLAETQTGEPLIDVTDASPVAGEGWLGVSSSGAAVSVDDLTLHTISGAIQVAPERRDSQFRISQNEHRPEHCPEPNPWPSFCLLLLNLNEFVYVD